MDGSTEPIKALLAIMANDFAAPVPGKFIVPQDDRTIADGSHVPLSLLDEPR